MKRRSGLRHPGRLITGAWGQSEGTWRERAQDVVSAVWTVTTQGDPENAQPAEEQPGLREPRKLASLDEKERFVGLWFLTLLSDWTQWVERRVESISFEDELTLLRHVSIDFTIPADAVSPYVDRQGRPILYVPLTLLQKQPLTRFSVRDEDGRALPILQAREDGAIGAATLIESARGAIANEDPDASIDPELPPQLEQQLWEIVNENDPAKAIVCLEKLLAREDLDEDSAAVLAQIEKDEPFRHLARDLASNFLVIVPLTIPPAAYPGNERRIVKISYEDHIQRPRTKRATLLDHAGDRLRGDRAADNSAGAVRSPLEPYPWREQFVRAAMIAPRTVILPVPMIGQGVSFHAELIAPEGMRVSRMKLVSYPAVKLAGSVAAAADGSDRDEPGPADAVGSQEPTETGTVAEQAGDKDDAAGERAAAAETIPESSVDQSTGRDRQLPVEEPSDAAGGDGDEPRTERGAWEDAGQPADQSGAEAERGDTATGRQTKSYTRAFVAVSLQRAHVFSNRDDQRASGLLFVNLRPDPYSVLWGAWNVSALAAVLLAVVGIAIKNAGRDAGGVAALVVLVPGALSAYVARGREPMFTTGALSFPRKMLNTVAAATIAAAAALLLGRIWLAPQDKRGPTAAYYAAGERTFVEPLLFGLAGLCAVVSVLLFIAYRRAKSPPEQRHVSQVHDDHGSRSAPGTGGISR